MRRNKKIQGITIGDQKILLSLFGDDLALMMRLDQRSWDAALNEFQYFQKSTGLTVNYEKSVIYRLGSIRNTNAKFYSQRKVSWSDKSIKILRIQVTADKQELLNENYDPILAKVEATLQIWKTGHLSLYEKILIVNALIASLYIYKFAVLPAPSEQHRKARISYDIIRGLKTDGWRTCTHAK